METFTQLCSVLAESYFRIGSPEKIAVAFSGGADSTALLLLLNQLRQKQNIQLRAVHVNHGLRENAKADEDFCRELCERLSIALDVCKVHVSREGSLEDAARRARYDAIHGVMEREQISCLALAHHMNDQAEGVLMHLIYGSGAEGLSGMREYAPPCWRPLLNVPKETLRIMLSELHQPWREDESNGDIRFTRNRIRHILIPETEKISAGAVSSIARGAKILRDESDCLNQIAAETLENMSGKEKFRFLMTEKLKELHPALQRRIIRLYLEKAGLLLDFSQTEKVRGLLLLPKGSKVNLPDDWHAVRTDNRIHFVPPEKAETETKTGNLKVLPYEGDCGDGRLRQAFPESVSGELRFRRPGDWITPFGMQGKCSLSDYMINHKIDAPFRDRWPLVCRGSEVLWVIGVGASQTLKVINEKPVLMIYDGDLPDKI